MTAKKDIKAISERLRAIENRQSVTEENQTHWNVMEPAYDKAFIRLQKKAGDVEETLEDLKLVTETHAIHWQTLDSDAKTVRSNIVYNHDWQTAQIGKVAKVGAEQDVRLAQHATDIRFLMAESELGEARHNNDKADLQSAKAGGLVRAKNVDKQIADINASISELVNDYVEVTNVTGEEHSLVQDQLVAARTDIQNHDNAIADTQDRLTHVSIDAWKALSDERTNHADVAAALAEVFDRLDTLEDQPIPYTVVEPEEGDTGIRADPRWGPDLPPPVTGSDVAYCRTCGQRLAYIGDHQELNDFLRCHWCEQHKAELQAQAHQIVEEATRL